MEYECKTQDYGCSRSNPEALKRIKENVPRPVLISFPVDERSENIVRGRMYGLTCQKLISMTNKPRPAAAKLATEALDAYNAKCSADKCKCDPGEKVALDAAVKKADELEKYMDECAKSCDQSKLASLKSGLENANAAAVRASKPRDGGTPTSDGGGSKVGLIAGVAAGAVVFAVVVGILWMRSGGKQSSANDPNKLTFENPNSAPAPAQPQHYSDTSSKHPPVESEYHLNKAYTGPAATGPASVYDDEIDTCTA